MKLPIRVWLYECGPTRKIVWFSQDSSRLRQIKEKARIAGFLQHPFKGNL